MRPGRARHHHLVAARPQVDVTVGPGAARVRRRAQLAQEAQLLEPGLELGAEHAPLDAVERAQRRLDRRPLALGAEVRAQPRPQVARPAHVEHLPGPVEEEVDARPLRRAEGERPLACTRRARVAPAPGGRRRSRRRAPARGRSGRAGSPPSPRRRAARDGTGARSCRRTARARRGLPARCDPPAAFARARPCRSPARRSASRSAARSRGRGRRGRSARCGRRAPSRRRRRGSGAPRPARTARAVAPGRRSRSGRRPPARAARPGWRASGRSRSARAPRRGRRRSRRCGRSRREPGRLEVDDDEAGELEREALGRRLGERDEIAAPREPRVRAHRLVEQPARDAVGEPAEREEPSRGLLGGDTGPRRSSTSSTSRSAASRRSCMTNHSRRTYVRPQAPARPGGSLPGCAGLYVSGARAADS